MPQKNQTQYGAQAEMRSKYGYPPKAAISTTERIESVKAYTLLAAGVISASLVACGDSKSTLIPSDMSKWDTELAETAKKLPEEEKRLFAGYMIRAKMGEALGGKGIPPGTTIGDAIAEQKKFVEAQEKQAAESAALKAKIEKQRQEARQQINGAITVAVTRLKLLEVAYSKQQVIQLGFQNNGTRDIAGVKGAMKFIDMFDKEVGEITFSYTDGVKAGGTGSWVGSRRYNEFIPEHRAIAGLQEGQYKAVFEPEMVVFSDGTKLAVPD